MCVLSCRGWVEKSGAHGPRSGGSKDGGSTGGGPKGGPVGWGPVERGKVGWGPKISRFFQSPATISFFSSLSWGSSRGILAGAVKCARLRSRVAGASHDCPSQRAFKNTTKIPREDPQREKKRTNFEAEREKRAKFWAVQGKGGPGEGRSREGRSEGTEHDQTKTLKPTPTRETPHHETVKPTPTPHKHTNTQTHHTPHTTPQVKLGLAKVGHDLRTPPGHGPYLKAPLRKSLRPFSQLATQPHNHTM